MNDPKKRLFMVVAKGTLAVGSVCLIAAVIFPIFAQAHMGGKQPCLSNLKQMHVATILYAEDNDDVYPPDDWMDVLKSDASEQTFHDRTASKKPDYGYAFREQALRNSTNSIANPSKFVLIFDSNLEGRNRHSELWSLPQHGTHGHFNGDQASTDFVINADGHVKSLYIRYPGSPWTELSSIEKALIEDDISQSAKRNSGLPTKKSPVH